MTKRKNKNPPLNPQLLTDCLLVNRAVLAGLNPGAGDILRDIQRAFDRAARKLRKEEAKQKMRMEIFTEILSRLGRDGANDHPVLVAALDDIVPALGKNSIEIRTIRGLQEKIEHVLKPA